MKNNFNNQNLDRKEAEFRPLDREIDNDENNNNIQNQEQLVTENNDEEDEEDDRLTYTLITLDLGNLIHIFDDNHISFVDLLLLTKEDLLELQLEIYQRNRILNFSKLFSKFAKNYSINEISDFFTFNKQFIFNSSLYDKVCPTPPEEQTNENINENFNLEKSTIVSRGYLESLNPNLGMSGTLPVKNLSKSEYNTVNMQSKRPEINNINKNINGKFENNINKEKNIENINSNVDNNEKLHNKLLELINKRKIKTSTNNYKQIHNNTNKNKTKNNAEKYINLIKKINELETAGVDYENYNKLNLIKSFIKNKGDKISNEDLKKINKDIDQLYQKIKIGF